MQEEINKPIFVVGSPRSGTSILAWCLGHHPNIFPVPESNWMADFAANIAVAHQIGSARGGLSILSAMDIRDDEFFAAFGRSINELVVGHRRHLEINRENSNSPSKLNQRWLEATSMAAGPKTRWVDGTPEYSLHICGLRKLFPQARFVHVFRDVDAVIRSMVNFHHAMGIQLVANEEEAYKYWLRMVKACLKAEEAYGPHVVYRLPYATLVENPESALRSLLDFLGEPYSAKCLEPLAQRINSSNVPVDFKSEDPATDPKVVEAARRLYAEFQLTPQPAEGSPAVADQLEAAFQEPYLKATRLQQELSEQIARVEHYAAEIEQYKLQLARQEQHYTAEIEEYKLQLARQERHYTAEIEQYKLQVARQERDYAAEIDEHKKQLASQEQHYTAEVEQYKLQVTRQERDYTTEIDEHKKQLASQEQHYTAEVEQYKLQVTRQQRHYTAEIDEHKEQLAKQEHHYAAEVEQYELQVARQERHYTTEIEEHKKQLAKQEHHYAAEVEQYKLQVARQERHYTAEIEVYQLQIARQEQHYTAEIEVYKSQIARLHGQLRDTRKLSGLLDNLENAAKQLSNSRRWKLANIGAVIKAKLSHGKVRTGYEPLDKIVAAYSRWRASHPEIAKLDDELNALQLQTTPKRPTIEAETALAAKTSGTSPPFS